MRLHHLEMVAFGPFAGREQVDFDALSDSGLFLLCGPTGAGKTSVLDAVCFALFGQVPGERDKAKRLHSDHAAVGSGPRVVLEVSVRGRRLRVTRSPEWTRPKKRGSGDIREHAKALVEERVDGRWQQRTNRIDEAADLIGSLLGMTMAQFCQVVMLPQGRFETFLRCGAQERHTLLERLFGTHRFRAVEDWLAEHRRAVGARSVEHARKVAGLLARVGEASGRTCPEDLHIEDTLDWVEDVRQAGAAALTDASQARTAADQRAKDARVALESARDRAGLQARHDDARARDAELRALSGSTEQMAAEVEQARLAATVRPFIEIHDAASARAGRAAAALEAARNSLPAGDHAGAVHTVGHLPGPDELDNVAAVVRDRHDRVARLESLLPTQQRIVDLDAELTQLHETVTSIEEERAGLDAQVRQRAEALSDTRAAHAEAVAARAQVAPLRDRVTAAERLAEAAEQLPDRRRRRERLLDARERATDRAQRARDRWLDLRQARLDGMAAELARDLVAGRRCPVCGATEHPRPAQREEEAVSAEQERAAEQGWQQAEQVRQQCVDDLAVCDRELGVLETAAAGTDPTAASARLGDARTELARAERAAARAETLAAEISSLEAAAEQAVARGQQHEADHAQACERRRLRSDERADLQARLRQATGGVRTLAECLDEARGAAKAWEHQLSALRELADARRAHEQTSIRLADALADAGFDDASDARAAMMSRTDLSSTETLLRRRADQAAQVRAVLTDPRVAEAAAVPRVPLDPLVAELEDAERRRDEALTRERSLEQRARRLEHLHAELADALQAWQPVRASLAVAERLAALCAGTSADNRHRMRLSAYVLAARLEQVVAAANDRLLAMSSGRFTLQHSVARGVGDRRGGLGLLVHDGWTGDLRDPATLSGGETFYTSLALALGLSDVVSHEAGGTEIDTLFVDEGFGTLDPDTLDEVMDVLDQLRSGGRAVGIVSHVADLRARVPAQVHVRKTRAGSTLVPHG